MHTFKCTGWFEEQGCVSEVNGTDKNNGAGIIYELFFIYRTSSGVSLVERDIITVIDRA